MQLRVLNVVWLGVGSVKWSFERIVFNLIGSRRRRRSVFWTSIANIFLEKDKSGRASLKRKARSYRSPHKKPIFSCHQPWKMRLFMSGDHRCSLNHACSTFLSLFRRVEQSFQLGILHIVVIDQGLARWWRSAFWCHRNDSSVRSIWEDKGVSVLTKDPCASTAWEKKHLAKEFGHRWENPAMQLPVPSEFSGDEKSLVLDEK